MARSAAVVGYLHDYSASHTYVYVLNLFSYEE
jgi:hypothetical protein